MNRYKFYYKITGIDRGLNMYFCRESGLMVQGIEPGGRINQDGRLKVHDRIIEINGQDLHNVTFPKYELEVMSLFDMFDLFV